jgi:D-serine deaminase-like pyridoxal phosphate-dependent protein
MASLDHLETPIPLINLDRLDANLGRMIRGAQRHQVGLRVHFKSFKCASLAKYLQTQGIRSFLCATLNEAEILVDAGIQDLLLANQVVGLNKAKRLVDLGKQADLSTCVDCPAHVEELIQALANQESRLGVFIEINVGMDRCGIETGEEALALARLIEKEPRLRLRGLQAYDGHLQGREETPERESLCRAGLDKAQVIRDHLGREGFVVEVVSGAGTSTWETVASHPVTTEIQPGSFLLMDAQYNRLRPEFQVSLTVMGTILGSRAGRYILDVGSKAISQDFTKPFVVDHPHEEVVKLNEEHTIVRFEGPPPRVGERRYLISGHCCATMNLHRRVAVHRSGKLEAIWPIEASGLYG